MTDPRFDGADIPAPRFADDDGSADEALSAALVAFHGDPAAREGVQGAVGTSRLLVPLVAVLDEVEEGEDGLRREKSSHMATVSMVGRDGQRALLAFTCVESLRAWDPQARPMPALGADVCRTAVDQGEDAVLIDVAGPVRFAITGEALRRLSQPDFPPERGSGYTAE